MKLALIQFNPWDRCYAKIGQDLSVAVGDYAIVLTPFGSELGRIVNFEDFNDADYQEIANEVKELERLANEEDLTAAKNFNQDNRKDEALKYCRQTIKRHGLEMKLVDCHFSFDDQRVSFAFIADGRVDFRNAVKELIKHFKKSVRLHQLGVRDEAKICGDIGPCGEQLCCRQHLKKLGNVSSDLAEEQQVAHRGSERLSGVCGRLKCCLAYEKELYEELAQKLPAIGTRVKTKHGRGEIIGWHTLRGSVDVKIFPEKAGEKELIVEVPIKK